MSVCIGCGQSTTFGDEYHCTAERKQAWENLRLREPVSLTDMTLSWAGLRNLGAAQLKVGAGR